MSENYDSTPWNLWVSKQYRDFGRGAERVLVVRGKAGSYEGEDPALMLRDEIIQIINRQVDYGFGPANWPLVREAISRLFEGPAEPVCDDEKIASLECRLNKLTCWLAEKFNYQR